MTRLKLLAPLLLTLFATQVTVSHRASAPSSATAVSINPGSLCRAGEQVVWSCETVKDRKLASICGSKDLDQTRGYVQYRFGRAGQVELEFPRERTGTQSAFKYSRYTRPLVTYLKLEFFNQGVSYTISDDSNDEEKPARRYAAITVKHSDGNAKEITLRCRNPVAGSLMKLETVVERVDY